VTKKFLLKIFQLMFYNVKDIRKKGKVNLQMIHFIIAKCQIWLLIN